MVNDRKDHARSSRSGTSVGAVRRLLGPAILAVAGLLAVASCGQESKAPHGPAEAVRVGVSTSIGGGLGSLGVPRDPETNESGVSEATLRVFRGGQEVFFDENGHEVGEADAVPVVLTPENSTATLFLEPATYDFQLTARDEQENELAHGAAVDRELEEGSTVFIPLTARIDSLSFSDIIVIEPDEVFEVFVYVHPPGRPDLHVPETDFLLGHGIDTGTIVAESNLGVRVAASCADVTITATARPTIGEEIVEDALNVAAEEYCRAVGSDIEGDLSPPIVSITSPEDGATIREPVLTLEGVVGDEESGVDRVDIYQGVEHLGDADVDENVEPHRWSFTVEGLEPGTHRFTAVAVDNAGNTSRAEVEVEVEVEVEL